MTNTIDGKPPTRVRQLDRYKGALGIYFEYVEENFIKKYLSLMGKFILDVGAGEGRLITRLPIQDRKLLELELSLDHLRNAKKRTALPSEIYFVCADGARLPLKAKTVDTAICLGTFEYIQNVEPILGELCRVCKCGGLLILSFWNYRRWDHALPFFPLEEHAKAHCLSDLQKIFKTNGLKLIEVRSVFYVPRRLFWLAYRNLPAVILKNIWVYGCLIVEIILMRIPFLRTRGNELIIAATIL